LFEVGAKPKTAMEARGYILGVSPLRPVPYPIQTVTTPALVYQARPPMSASRNHSAVQSDGSEEDDIKETAG